MGMYNVMFGPSDAGYVLLGMLGFDRPSDVGRWRDTWIEGDGQDKRFNPIPVFIEIEPGQYVASDDTLPMLRTEEETS